MNPYLYDLQDHDESVRIAVKALGDMRNGAARSDDSNFFFSAPPAYDSKSSSLEPPMASTSQTSSATTTPETCNPNSPGLVSRMSHIPLVESALWAYEHGKASSRVVKYGAEIVESSVKTISRPVIDRLPVNQLDQFACRQLDKLDKYRSAFSSSAKRSCSPIHIDSVPLIADSGLIDLESREDRVPSLSRESGERSSGKNVSCWLEGTSPFIAPPPPPPDTRSVTPTQTNSKTSQSKNCSDQTAVAQRSRWQAMLLEAGGLSAALSEDSMRRLKYCLQWLQYATAHIDAQILILRDFIASLQPLPSRALSANRRPPISEEHMRRLTDVRRDIVHTIRQVVDVVSKYAGGALPQPAKNRVRGFILGLPHRWASKASSLTASFTGAAVTTGERERSVGGTVAAATSGTGAAARRGQQRRAARERGGDTGSRSSMSLGAPSPSVSSPRLSRPLLSGNNADDREKVGVSEGSAMVAAQRVLTLATESLDMMRNVTGVVKDSLDRADAWVGRLRTVGLQREVQEGDDDDDDISLGARSTPIPSEPDSPYQRRHRRTISSQSSALSVNDDAELLSSPVSSGSSSTIWASSIPSTPGRSDSSVSFASVHMHPVKNPGESGRLSCCENESWPGLYLMSLSGTSSSNGEDGEPATLSGKEDEKNEVKVVGLDVDEEEGKMEVDI